MYQSYFLVIAPEGSLSVVIHFLTLVMVRISIGVVVDVAMVLVIFFVVEWRRVPIPMVQHVLLFGAVRLKERQLVILVFDRMIFDKCLHWDILMVNELCLADLGRMALDTAVLISPEKLLVAGQRRQIGIVHFLTNTLWIEKLGLLDDYLNAMAVMLNLMMW